ncbi:hypothetical protein ALO61_101742 [Pseudomonas savastanoi pv. nerii]|nr:hypothetical protein ALO61_101742 [Pseudomonas savastanoi pv. nerii]
MCAPVADWQAWGRSTELRESLAPMQRFVEPQTNKNPQRISDEGFWNLILTMTYSHMGKPHTTIGDTSFHC